MPEGCSVPNAPPGWVRAGGGGGSPLSFDAVQPELFSTPGAQPLARADFDGDGDPDLLLANNDPVGGGHPVYRNDMPPEAAARGGYCSRGTSPVHVGLPPGVRRVVVEMTAVVGGRRKVFRADATDVPLSPYRVVEIRLPEGF